MYVHKGKKLIQNKISLKPKDILINYEITALKYTYEYGNPSNFKYLLMKCGYLIANNERR